MTILPGEQSRADIIAQMIRVNQAGEYGAARIYKGQLDQMKNSPMRPIVEQMQEQEQVHLETFNQILRNRRVRPTLLSPLWHVAGYMLGAITARLGDKAAMACTVAVEEVIQDHYEEQLEILKHYSEEQDLYKIIAQFQKEEREHHDKGVEAGASDALGFRIETTLIKTISRMAIWLSTRF